MNVKSPSRMARTPALLALLAGFILSAPAQAAPALAIGGRNADLPNVIFDACTGNTLAGPIAQSCFGLPAFPTKRAGERSGGGSQAPLSQTDGYGSNLFGTSPSGEETFKRLALSISEGQGPKGGIPSGVIPGRSRVAPAPKDSDQPAGGAGGSVASFHAVFGSGAFTLFPMIPVGTNGAAVPVPEPSSLALFGLGALGLGLVKPRRRAA